MENVARRNSLSEMFNPLLIGYAFFFDGSSKGNHGASRGGVLYYNRETCHKYAGGTWSSATYLTEFQPLNYKENKIEALKVFGNSQIILDARTRVTMY